MGPGWCWRFTDKPSSDARSLEQAQGGRVRWCGVGYERAEAVDIAKRGQEALVVASVWSNGRLELGFSCGCVAVTSRLVVGHNGS